MSIVIITGSTRGIGLGMANCFLKRGHKVVISGRDEETVKSIMSNLTADYDSTAIHGIPCDMRRIEQIQGLWDATVAHFGQVDIWINNAGMAHNQEPIYEQAATLQEQVIATNILGVIYGSSIAMRGMLEQGFGAIYNMSGLGSDGRYVKGLALYGSTKRAVDYLTRAMIKEMKGTPVMVGSLSPGMVITDLITGQYVGNPEEWAKVKGIFNILAERVEIVTPWLVNKILANKKHGASIKYLTSAKVAWRFLTAPISKRNIFTGNDLQEASKRDMD